MWTPKRILILVAGLAVFLSGYSVYAYFLGGIDGLPPLPEEYCESGPNPDPPPPSENPFDKKLIMAFGSECRELKCLIKLDLRRRAMGIASDQFEPQKDGRIRLTPFSAFLMSKKKGKDGFPEISTVQCDEAYLTLDKQISNMAELGSRKIIEVELRALPPRAREAPEDKQKGTAPKSVWHEIVIKNNRGTMEANDDLDLRVTNAPVLFVEKKNEISTNGSVHLLDCRPGSDNPTDIRATGMLVRLNKDKDVAAAPARDKRGPKKDNSSAVKELVLNSNVQMWLWVDAQSGFFGSGASGTAKKSPPPAKEKTKAEQVKVTISTPGRFTFDPARDHAVFESPPGEHVDVQRENKRDAPLDHLECSRLELQFRRKSLDETTAGGEDATSNKEIEMAHAMSEHALAGGNTGGPAGELVRLKLPLDKIEVWGTDIVYHGQEKNHGPKTVIRGEPLHASKEGHYLVAKELTIIGADKNGNGQEAFARGPGKIDLFDKTKTDPEKQHPWHAVFKESLTSVKDKQGDKVCDLLTLTGDARFWDDEHKQELQGKRLQVWLEPTGPGDDKKDPADTKEMAPGAARQKPHMVDAFENVALYSPKMNITSAHHLVIHFKDGVAGDVQLPDALPAAKKEGPVTLPSAAPSGTKSNPAGATAKTPGASPATSKQPGSPGPTKEGKTADGDMKKEQPINLEAREVTAYVTRMGSQNILRELVTRGAVHVHQNGATPKDRGVDITGDMLNLLHFEEQGDILHVFGTPRKAAELQMGDITLSGPAVSINQRENVAEVKGLGAMHLPAKTTLDGSKAAPPGTRLQIHWNERMLFNGKHADFYGGVLAYQDASSLRCLNLQVELDRVVSFKEGQKGGQEAKVEKMVCDRKVFAIEEKRGEKGELISYHRLEATEAFLDNPAETTRATGPGRVYLLDMGGNNQGPVGPGAGGQKQVAGKKELQLTRIDFGVRMFSNNNKDIRTSKFYENVEVYHCPADRPDLQFNPDRPPKDGFYLRCDVLTNYTKVIDKDKKAQFMQAEGKVTFRTQEFYGHAPMVKFNEAQNLVIFEGTAVNPASLFQFQPGGQTREIKGSKILYNRGTGQISLEGGTNIESGGR